MATPSTGDRRSSIAAVHPPPFIRRSGEQQVRNLLVLREPLLRLLREDELAVDGDLEDPASRLDELDLDVGVERLQLGGQTDRLGLVVSLHAVLDRDLHRCSWCFLGVCGGAVLARVGAVRTPPLTQAERRSGNHPESWLVRVL